jgi:hypothetical protein
MIIENGVNKTGGISLSISSDEMYALIHYSMLDEKIRNVFMEHLSLDPDVLKDNDRILSGYSQLSSDGVMNTDFQGMPQFVDLNDDSPLVYWMIITLSTMLSRLQSVVDIRIMMGRSINEMVVISDGDSWMSLWRSKGNMISIIGAFDKSTMPFTLWSKLERFVSMTRSTRTRNLIISFNRYDDNDDIILGTSVYGCLPIFNETIPTNALLSRSRGRKMIDGMYTYASFDDIRDRIQRIIEVV